MCKWPLHAFAEVMFAIAAHLLLVHVALKFDAPLEGRLRSPVRLFSTLEEIRKIPFGIFLISSRLLDQMIETLIS